MDFLDSVGALRAPKDDFRGPMPAPPVHDGRDAASASRALGQPYTAAAPSPRWRGVRDSGGACVPFSRLGRHQSERCGHPTDDVRGPVPAPGRHDGRDAASASRALGQPYTAAAPSPRWRGVRDSGGACVPFSRLGRHQSERCGHPTDDVRGPVPAPGRHDGRDAASASHALGQPYTAAAPSPRWRGHPRSRRRLRPFLASLRRHRSSPATAQALSAARSCPGLAHSPRGRAARTSPAARDSGRSAVAAANAPGQQCVRSRTTSGAMPRPVAAARRRIANTANLPRSSRRRRRAASAKNCWRRRTYRSVDHTQSSRPAVPRAASCGANRRRLLSRVGVGRLTH